ncbi:ubiquitin carboxyl-terminal hydrolase 22 [Planoprotostelium fungivorum]|uniref:ubiquitinyl hydrolase 1 n=1 Tax=Planoprotostelium fungivorum TaxID=1890364 RepID=A0A2P6NC67_9EUKA|nr:ubiquitin carboxyl-terminal hydrolase 22 [Planoprotostelium fungivorum]
MDTPAQKKGMSNAGNTCFFNCMAQSLLHLLKFRAYLNGISESVGTDDKYLHSILSQLNKELTDTSNESPYINSLSIINRMKQFPELKKFLNGFQQDAHEFQTAVLTKLDSYLSNHHPKAEIPFSFLPSMKMCTPQIVKIQRKPSLPLKAGLRCPLEGQMISTLKCQHCEYANWTCFPFTDIALSVHDAFTAGDVKEYLKAHTERESISDWKCDKCLRIGAFKQLQILRQPDVLCLYFRRSVVDTRGASFKINTHINFPTKLSLEPYCANFGAKETKASDSSFKKTAAPVDTLSLMGGNKMFEQPIQSNSNSSKREPEDGPYTLSSVIEHVGATNQGHYMVYLKGTKGGWHISDCDVRKVELSEIHNANASMLFYSKKKPVKKVQGKKSK